MIDILRSYADEILPKLAGVDASERDVEVCRAVISGGSFVGTGRDFGLGPVRVKAITERVCLAAAYPPKKYTPIEETFVDALELNVRANRCACEMRDAGLFSNLDEMRAFFENEGEIDWPGLGAKTRSEIRDALSSAD